MESGPVFADASGRRRRVMRYAGFGAAAVLSVCLGAVAIAMTGGPRAPFTQWAGPHPAASASAGHSSRQANGRSPDGSRSTAAGQDPAGGAPGANAPTTQSASPSAAASPTAGPSASASTSPAPTNPVGKTPPGQSRSPNPHKSASVV